MFHRASCGHLIFRSDETVSLTATAKACALQRVALEASAKERGIARLAECESCRP
jgi:hypothetical protein